ncbi:Ribosomal large subunit pseudouridine synthase B [Anatilimnocola aggregata]|uniref:Pseudouridine synthase n=1 Tax=Anatilimnocola aggregata TaxID=2528021 RepID=A0A517YB06_9BACT|nr:pseudouridine synthase [Anatilimnocola aggregata]QDU27384.1 Ribosomal large subunit pseudouridine synthase B [Anatilimnocola aggregata]
MTRPRKSRPNQQSRPSGRAAAEHETAGAQRLQKVLAAAGVASRRDCEELIREGRVEVDRKVVTELGTRVDPSSQEIRVDGEPLRQPKRVYFALNKPVDVVCTNFDPSGRARVIDLVPNDERVFAVGRLDRASEGLILVTNDGLFANHITHPRYGVEKTYLVRVAGRPGPEALAKLRRGVHLAEGFCKVESVVVKGRHKQSSDLLMVLDEGRNREIRRVLAKVGHKVLKLKRIAIGGLKLGMLETGEWRKLSGAEIESLLAISRQKRKEKKKVPPRELETVAESTEQVVILEQPIKAPKKRPAAEAAIPSASPSTPAKKPPSASSIAAKLLAGKDFEDDDEDFLDSFADDDFDDDSEEESDFSDDDEDDDDDETTHVKQTVIMEEITDDEGPPRSGPAPRGDVIDFDEDGPPPLQPARVREPASTRPQPRRREETKPVGNKSAGNKVAARSDRSGPLRAEPRTGHRSASGQEQRRGQRHRREEEMPESRGRGVRQESGRSDRPGGNRGRDDRRNPTGARPAGSRSPGSKPEGGRRGQRTEAARVEGARGEGRPNKGRGTGRPGQQMTRVAGRHVAINPEAPRGDAIRSDERPAKMPRRPGKLVAARPQENRGARGKYPGKITGKGKREDIGGGGGGGKNIFGKRVRKKGKSS